MTTPELVLGVDIGTSSTKGVLTDLAGTIVATTTREHRVARPQAGHVEMDPVIWWDEFVSIAEELLADRRQVQAVGVSGMGPCVALVDARWRAVRPAILYGVDMRAVAEIAEWTAELGGDDQVLSRCGSVLTTQAVGPKIAWVARHETAAYARACRLLMPSSWLVHELTGEYVLDHHSASQSVPLYDIEAGQWNAPWAERIAPGIDLPRLAWPGEIAGAVSRSASAATGIAEGTPVITGTVDAWSEALSVDAHNVGDLMLMYGTTMFLVNTVDRAVREPSLWGPVGALPGTRCLAGGMATSGAITSWLRDLVGDVDYTTLTAEADASGPGACGLLMLPYFAGERTPIMDPDARGVLAGLTVSHTRGDLYRAALEATAFGVRHNIEAMEAAGGQIERIVAVGGGTTGGVWTQIVSDITGREQTLATHTVGASFGAAWLAARTMTDIAAAQWNPPSRVITPRGELQGFYDQRYAAYRQLYLTTREICHALAQARA